MSGPELNDASSQNRVLGDDSVPSTESPDARSSLCDDCGDQNAVRIVQCPVDEALRLELCEACYDERGPGIDVCHVQRDSNWDINGGRAAGELTTSEKRHMNNTAYPAAGWLGNPYPMEDDSDEERWRVLKWFREDFITTVQEEPFFAYHLGKLRGKRVACWCRSADEGWPGDGAPCHLDVVHAALMGLYRDADAADGTGAPK